MSMLSARERNKIYLVRHGIDLTVWEQTPETQREINLPEIHILCVGRLVEKKGVIYLLKAVRLLKKTGRQVFCRIVGEGPQMSALKAFVNDNDLVKSVQFEGRVDPEKTFGFYQQARLFVLPSIISGTGDFDGLPNVLLEAAAAGIPIITTSISAIPEFVLDGITGLLVPERDAAALAGAILSLIDNKKMTKSLSKMAKEKLLRSSTLKIMVENYWKYLNNI